MSFKVSLEFAFTRANIFIVLFDKKEDKMNNDYDNLVRYLITRKGYSKIEARGEAWRCIAKKALKHELARNDVHSDEWMSTEELSEFGLTR